MSVDTIDASPTWLQRCLAAEPVPTAIQPLAEGAPLPAWLAGYEVPIVRGTSSSRCVHAPQILDDGTTPEEPLAACAGVNASRYHPNWRVVELATIGGLESPSAEWWVRPCGSSVCAAYFDALGVIAE